MDEVFKRILDKLTGANFWIVLGFLAAGYLCWRWIGTTATDKKKVLRRQISIGVVIAVLALTGMVACSLPAHRAARIAPTEPVGW